MRSYHLSLGWTVKDLAWTLETKLVVTGRCMPKLHSYHSNGMYRYMYHGRKPQVWVLTLYCI